MCANYTLLMNEFKCKITYLAHYLITCYIVNVLFLFNQLQEVVNLKHKNGSNFILFVYFRYSLSYYRLDYHHHRGFQFVFQQIPKIRVKRRWLMEFQFLILNNTNGYHLQQLKEILMEIDSRFDDCQLLYCHHCHATYR